MTSKSRLRLGVGLVLVAIAFAAWGFSIGELTRDQRTILLWVLPLASGVGAASFAGGIAAKLDGLIPGVAITAAGGFAVWCLSFFFLFPSGAGAEPPRDGVEITFPKRVAFEQAVRNIEDKAEVTVMIQPSCGSEVKQALVPVGPHRGASVEDLLGRIIERTPVNGIKPVRRISDARFEIECS